ncbi:MAG: energy transducer TonB [Acidobacteriota bacterium]
MPRDLFGNVTRRFDGVGARSRYTLPLSLAAHTLAVAAIVVVPLVASDALPALRERLQLTTVTPIVPPEPPRPRVVRPPDAPPMAINAAPTSAPEGFTKEPEIVRDPAGGVDSGIGVVDGIEHGVEMLEPPPPAPKIEKAPVTVRVGGGIKPPTKIADATPGYPAIAQAARVQGVVIIQATIGTDGRVIDATVLRSVPLLDEAALAAVRQWRYTATQLNGAPVAVVMTVTVNFTLR